MAIAHIRTSAAQVTANDATPTLTYNLPSLPSAGTLIVVSFFGFGGTGGPGAITVGVNQSGSFTLQSAADSANWRTGFAYLTVPSGWSGTATITVEAANAYSWLGFIVSEYSGALTTSTPYDNHVFDGDAGTLTSLQVVGSAGSQADSLIISGVAAEEYDGNANLTTPGGYTSRGVNQDWALGTPFRVADKILSATTAESPTFGFDSSPIAVGFQVRFKAFLGGSPVTLTGGGELPTGNEFAPSVSWVSAPAATATAGSAFAISASALDDLGVASITLKRDGVVVATGVGNVVSFAGNHPISGVVVWDVTATDTDDQVTTLSATTTISGDVVAPTITLASNILSVTSITQQPFLTATVSDNTAVDRVEFFRGIIGAGTLIATTTGEPHRAVLGFTSADNGVVPYFARVYDSAGNFANSSVVNITVAINTTPPPDVDDDWVTVVRNANVWVQVPRNT